MSSNELVEQIMAQVIARVATPEQQAIPTENHPIRETAMAEKSCSLTEFVGTAIGDTLGLVIANVDTALLDAMKLEKRYRSIGILGARTGAGPHIMAADEAVKATNTEVVSIELPRDTKGGAGHGSLIILGGNDVSDVKRGIEVALKELDRTFGDVYGNEAGHIELQSANVEVVAYSSPAHGTSFSNEAILVISGDSGAVRQAVTSAREIGKTVLATLGAEPKNDRPSYI